MKFALPRTIVLILCLLVSRLSFADTLTGKVVRIADGNTITVQDSSGQELEIRLQGIDAPEHNQAFGQEATTNLEFNPARFGQAGNSGLQWRANLRAIGL